MLVPGPLVEWKCILSILRGEGLLVLEFPQFPIYAFLIRGDAPPWPITKTGRLAGPEIRSLFEVAGLDFDRLSELERKHCGEAPPPPGPTLN
jgi:hypothetical protein